MSFEFLDICDVNDVTCKRDHPASDDFIDGQPLSGQLLFEAGVTRQTFRVQLLNDVESEGAETFRVALALVNRTVNGMVDETASELSVTILASDDGNGECMSALIASKRACRYS